jgi:uncharacterized protein YndB with AHSA1/START domain
MTPKGIVVIDGERASIEFERQLPYPIEDVWEAITDPEQLACWLAPTTIEPHAGGTIVVEGGPKDLPIEVRRATGRILEWNPPHTLEYEWHQAIIEDSTVRFELEGDEHSTTLRLRHRWLSPANAGGFAPGWHSYLDRLGAHLGGEEVPEWGDRYAMVLGTYH